MKTVLPVGMPLHSGRLSLCNTHELSLAGMATVYGFSTSFYDSDQYIV